MEGADREARCETSSSKLRTKRDQSFSKDSIEEEMKIMEVMRSHRVKDKGETMTMQTMVQRTMSRLKLRSLILGPTWKMEVMIQTVMFR